MAPTLDIALIRGPSVRHNHSAVQTGWLSTGGMVRPARLELATFCSGGAPSDSRNSFIIAYNVLLCKELFAVELPPLAHVYFDFLRLRVKEATKVKTHWLANLALPLRSPKPG